MTMLFLLPAGAVGQDTSVVRLLPEGLGIANQMKYSYNREMKTEIFEDWLNADYRYGILRSGIRMDVFQPNDPNPSVNRGKTRYADIAFKYIGISAGTPSAGAELTVGNFYAMFGRGLVLNSYEDRNIRVDNNLLGVKLVGRYAGVTLTALTGRLENFTSVRTDILHAIDVEYRPWSFLKCGASFASNQPDVDGAARTRVASLRAQPSMGNFDFYAEYGVKHNDDVKETVFHGSESIVGKGFYTSGSFFEGPLSLTAEYKYYDNFAFRASDQITSYNTPPSTRRDYAHILLNRHPSPLDQNNEQGFQAELNCEVSDVTSLNASYGVTHTLPEGSYYQRYVGTSSSEQTQLLEGYAHVRHEWSDDCSTTLALGYAEERATNTKNITPILEGTIGLDEFTSIHAAIEHQHVTDRTTQERYYNDVVMVECLRSPDLSLSIVGEMQTREPIAGTIKREIWLFVQGGFRIADHTDATLLIGNRQAGYICIGGVCRYEPEFSGVELKLFSRF